MSNIKIRKAMIKPFIDAFRGLLTAVKSERNLKIHLFAVVLVTFAGVYAKIKPAHWLTLVIIMGMVVSAELLNTAIEKLVDLVSPDHNKDAGKIKDIAAGAVLITSISAIIVAILLLAEYWPKD